MPLAMHEPAEAAAAAAALQTMNDDNPPILKTWRRLYTAVLLTLAVEVVLFYLFTRTLS
jgi:hypothetical protein